MTQLIPAGVTAGANQASEAASAPVRSRGLAGGSLCPPLHPGTFRLLRLRPWRASCVYAGKEEKNQAIMSTLLLPGPRSRADAHRIREEKQQKLASLIFSPSPDAFHCLKKKNTNSSRPISLHPPTPKLRASKEGVGRVASLSLGPLACGGLITPISG